MSPLEKLIVAAVLAFLAAGAIWAGIDHIDDRGYQRAKAEDREAAEAQAARNRDLARAAELRYTVAAEARERVIVETITEVRHASAALAACPVGAAVGVLNRAAACARGDSTAACGPGEPVPVAR